MNTSIFIN